MMKLRMCWVIGALVVCAGTVARGQNHLEVGSEIFAQSSVFQPFNNVSDYDSNPVVFGDPLVPGVGVTTAIATPGVLTGFDGSTLYAQTGGIASPGSGTELPRLGVYANVELTGADDPSFAYSSIGVASTATWMARITATAADPIYLVPTFELDGTLAGDGEADGFITLIIYRQGDLDTIEVFGQAIPHDGSTMVIDTMAGGVGVLLEPGVPTDVYAALGVLLRIGGGVGLNPLPQDGGADVDFYSTATLVSLAAYSDPGLHTLATGVTLETDENSPFDLNSILVPEPGSVILGGLGGLWVIGAGRKRVKRGANSG